MWNPNAVDNSKILPEQLYQASKRHIHYDTLDSGFNTIAQVFFALHSNKCMVILELKIPQHQEFPQICCVGGIPNSVPVKKQSCFAIYFSQRQSAQWPSQTHPHILRDRLSPASCTEMRRLPCLPAQCHINIYRSFWVHRGLFLTDKDIQRSNPRRQLLCRTFCPSQICH